MFSLEKLVKVKRESEEKFVVSNFEHLKHFEIKNFFDKREI